MLKRVGLVLALLTITGVSFADQTIETATASGNAQTTIIDANGNLKVVDTQKPAATSTATNQTVTSSENPNPNTDLSSPSAAVTVTTIPTNNVPSAAVNAATTSNPSN